MKLGFDISRCTGNWVGLSGEFGKTLDPYCIDCQRRLQTQHSQRQSWMDAPERGCTFKIAEEK